MAALPAVSQAVWNVQRRAVRVDSPTARHSMLHAACVAAPCSVLAALCCCDNCARSALPPQCSEMGAPHRGCNTAAEAHAAMAACRLCPRLSGDVQRRAVRVDSPTARHSMLHAACVAAPCSVLAALCCCDNCARSALTLAQCSGTGAPHRGCNTAAEGMQPWPHYRLCPRLSGTCRGVQCVWTRPLRGTACCTQPALLRHAAC